MASKLEGIWPINVIDHEMPGAWVTPDASTLGNIPLLRKILDQIVQDWKSEAAKYNLPASRRARDHVRSTLFFDAVDMIIPRFIQSLFSYIVFFFMVENGYHLVYSRLNKLNDDLGLHLPHGRLPQRTEFRERLWLVRNFSVAHWSGTENKRRLDSSAGRDWGIFWNQNASLEELQFGATGVSGSKNRQLEPLPEIHRLCSLYLDEFDEVCANYLLDIKSYLPLKVGSREYSNPVKPIKFRVLGNPIN